MKKVVIFLVVILFTICGSFGSGNALSQPAKEPDIFLKISQNGKKGLKNSEGFLVLNPIYQDFGVSQVNGMLAVKRENKWGFVDNNFDEVIKPEYDEVTYFYHGWCPARSGKLWGLIDVKGQWIIKPSYDSIEISQETKLAIIVEKGKYGLINGDGKVKINTKYEKLNFLQGGVLSFVQNGKTGIINENGIEIVHAEYKGIWIDSDFPEKSKYCFSVQIEEEMPTKGGFYIKNKTGFIEKSGKVTIIDKYESFRFFREDIGIIRDEFYNKVGLVDINLNPLVKQIYTEIKPYSGDEFIAVKYDRYHGTIDKKGKEIIKPVYTYMTKVGENLLVCNGNLKGGKWGIIDKRGKVVAPIKYSAATTNGEYICFEENGLWGVMDAVGSITTKPQFSAEPTLSENNILFVLNYMDGYTLNAGYFNVFGQSLTKSISDLLYPFENGQSFYGGMAPVKMNGKWGCINTSGELVIPCSFDSINSGFNSDVAWVTGKAKDGKLKFGLINKKGKYIIEPQFNGPAFSAIISVN